MTSKGDRLSLPFMLSQTNSRQQTDGGDLVSEITSPFEEQSYGSSLFSRLSRGQRTSHQDRSQSSPSSPEGGHLDYLSTINSTEESIHREESKSNSSVSDKQPQRVQGTGTDYSLSNSRANDDESYSMMFSSNDQNDKSISWDISPMKEHKTTSRCSISTGIQSSARNTTRPQLEVTMVTASTDTSSRVANDNEWRQVEDTEGRTYYYNRKTRVSKWHLPPGAVVVKKKVSNKSYDSQLLKTPKQPMSRQLNHSRQNDESAIANHSPAKVKISKSQQSVATYDDYNEHKEGDCDSYSSDGGYSSVAEDESLENITNRLQIPDIKSPQDASPSCDALYCVYCGVKCDTTTVLAHHLTTCKAFEQLQLHGQSTQMEIESLLFKAWSQIGNSTGVPSIMPTIQPTVKHSFNQEEVRYSSPQKFEALSYNETFSGGNDVTSSYEQTYVAAAPPKTPTSTRKARREVENVYCIEKKSCPFCQLEFNKGNELSSHLLKCKARKSARKQRRKKKESPPVSPYEPRSLRKPVTPGRRMPVSLISFESGLCI